MPARIRTASPGRAVPRHPPRNRDHDTAPKRPSAPELIDTLLGIAAASAEAFVSRLGRDSRERLEGLASKGVSAVLNSMLVSEMRDLVGLWMNGSCADEFGKDATLVEFLRPLFQFMYYHYFRVDVRGTRSIPRRGPAILVANHAGTLPYDGAMVHLAVYNELSGQREVRFLVDDFVFRLPAVGTLIERIGGVRACHENAEALLSAGHLIVVFPEGIKGNGKPYDERYQLKRFGRGGFVRLAIRTGAPIIPVAIVGSEETHPIIWKSESLGRRVGLPFVPFTPTFPWLGPLGLVPLPSKWKIMFGKVHAFNRHKPADADDEKLVGDHADEIKAEIQLMLDDALRKRTSIWR